MEENKIISFKEISAQRLVEKLMGFFKAKTRYTEERKAQLFLRAIENSSATTKAGRLQDAIEQMEKDNENLQ